MKMRKNGKKEKGKEEIQKFNGENGLEKAADLFFFPFHFQETTETFKRSTKVEISTGKA